MLARDKLHHFTAATSKINTCQGLGVDVFNCIVSQERTYNKIKCCLSLIVYKIRRVENTHQPKKVEARSVLLQDSLLGDKAVNAGI